MFLNVNFEFCFVFISLTFLYIFIYFTFAGLFWVSKVLGTFYNSFKVNNQMSDNILTLIHTVLTQQIIAVVQTSPVYIYFFVT